MSILTNVTFWIIIAAIIIVLALIGYLAEGTEFANKSLAKKQRKEDKKNIEKTTSAAEDEKSVVDTDLPVEVLKVPDTPNAWSDNIPKVDERMETVHKVDSIDDWTKMPEIKLENPNKTSESKSEEAKPAISMDDSSQEMFPDIKPSDLEPAVSETPKLDNDSENESVWK